MLPDRSGMDVLADIRTKDQETPIIMLTAYGSVEVAVNAIKAGANDYFSKPWDNEKLLIEIEYHDREEPPGEREYAAQARAEAAVQLPEYRRQERANAARSRPGVASGAEPGDDPADWGNRNRQGNDRQGDSLQLAASRTSLRRSKQRFAAAGTAGIHVVRARKRARSPAPMLRRKGYFEIADGGTIFFDEIGNVGPETQSKLLRVIQEREFMPLGSTEIVKVDVRIIAATNEDLRKLVEEGRFREDLYYRLNVINIALPPLRERKIGYSAAGGPLLPEVRARERKVSRRAREDKTPVCAGSHATADRAFLARQCPRIGECGGACRGPGGGGTGADGGLPDQVLHPGGVRIRRDEGGRLPADASLFEVVADFERLEDY